MNHSYYIFSITHKRWDLRQQSESDGSSFTFNVPQAALNLFFFVKSLNIPFTNYFQDRKSNFNLQIFIGNPILAGLYLFNIGWGGGPLILPLRAEIGECDTCKDMSNFSRSAHKKNKTSNFNGYGVQGRILN